jgi:hypothetical protein
MENRYSEQTWSSGNLCELNRLGNFKQVVMLKCVGIADTQPKTSRTCVGTINADAWEQSIKTKLGLWSESRHPLVQIAIYEPNIVRG